MPEIWSPAITITVQNPSHPNLNVRIEGLIDTGSEVSAIPRRIVSQLRLNSRKRMQVTGVNGLGFSFKRYLVNLEIAELRLERRGVIEWSGDFVIIARDLLSEFVFTYDGKNRRFEIRDP